MSSPPQNADWLSGIKRRKPERLLKSSSCKVELSTFIVLYFDVWNLEDDGQSPFICCICVRSMHFRWICYVAGGTECADSARQQAKSCNQNDCAEICPLHSRRWVSKTLCAWIFPSEFPTNTPDPLQYFIDHGYKFLSVLVLRNKMKRFSSPQRVQTFVMWVWWGTMSCLKVWMCWMTKATWWDPRKSLRETWAAS